MYPFATRYSLLLVLTLFCCPLVAQTPDSRQTVDLVGLLPEATAGYVRIRTGELWDQGLQKMLDERPWFSQHRGRRGPCKHILAANLFLEGDHE